MFNFTACVKVDHTFIMIRFDLLHPMINVQIVLSNFCALWEDENFRSKLFINFIVVIGFLVLLS